jgi:uncharacterized protein YcbX
VKGSMMKRCCERAPGRVTSASEGEGRRADRRRERAGRQSWCKEITAKLASRARDASRSTYFGAAADVVPLAADLVVAAAGAAPEGDLVRALLLLVVQLQ